MADKHQTTGLMLMSTAALARSVEAHCLDHHGSETLRDMVLPLLRCSSGLGLWVWLRASCSDRNQGRQAHDLLEHCSRFCTFSAACACS